MFFSTGKMFTSSCLTFVLSHFLNFFPRCLASTLLPLLLHDSPLLFLSLPSFPLLPADARCQAATASATSVGSTPLTAAPMGVRWQPADRRRGSWMAHPSTGRPSRQRVQPVPPQAVMALDMLMEASSRTAGKDACRLSNITLTVFASLNENIAAWI